MASRGSLCESTPGPESLTIGEKDVKNNDKRGAASIHIAAVLGSLLMSTAAFATDGYFQDGVGARNTALAGAGVADSRDATAAALNPAGLVHVGNEIDVALSFFNPSRNFAGSGGQGFTPTGTYTSDSNFFAIPNIAATWRVPNNPLVDVIGVSLSGNGGMNTNWKNVANPTCQFAQQQFGLGTGSGVFCGGRSGVDLTQALISVALAKQLGSVSVGVAPVLGAQYFEARGLSAFSQFSSSPTNLTDNGHDLEFGVGVRGGIEWAVTPSVRLGFAGASKIYMQPFGSYKGLFAEQGGFDVPANLQTGVAVDLTPNLTAMVDYKHIFYSGVASITTASAAALMPGNLGSNTGAGFGWQDVDAIKVGLEWRSTDKLTLRAGYNWNSQPIQSKDVMFNILAPGLVQSQFTGGLAYKWSSSMDIEFAAMYAPRVNVSGPELPFSFGGPPFNSTHVVDISLQEFEATVGLKYHY